MTQQRLAFRLRMLLKARSQDALEVQVRCAQLNRSHGVSRISECDG
jgi:hypothetical protein